MPSDTFYNEHDQALRPVAIETRDSLKFLAIQILASKVDLSSVNDYDQLIRQLRDIIDDLQTSYQRVRP